MERRHSECRVPAAAGMYFFQMTITTNLLFRSVLFLFRFPFLLFTRSAHCLGRNDFVGRLAAQVNAIKRRRERKRLVIASLGRIFEAACGRRLNCGSISERERGHGRTRHISTHESPGDAVAHGRYLDEQI